MEQKEALRAFYTAADLLPERLWRAAYELTEEQRPLCEELRVRLGRPMTAVVGGRQITLSVSAAAEELMALLARASEYSLQSAEAQLAQGFLTTRNGHRVGICGEAVEGAHGMTALRGISSVNIRIAKQLPALPDGLDTLGDPFESTLILAPPGAGKTTLLRALCKMLSVSYRVCIADSRCEIAACSGGTPRMDVGLSDVFSGGSLHVVLPMLTRAMSPQILVCDEITRAEDAHALAESAVCGCRFLATAHGRTPEDLHRSPVYRVLLETGVFRRLVQIEQVGSTRCYTVSELRT